MASDSSSHGLLKLLAPGMLVAATGVGAGDLITASLGGSAVGLQILWSVIVGAVLKWTLNEGISRWQMATGMTLLEGWVWRLGSWIEWIFVCYLLGWTVFTGGALVSACGVAGTSLLPLSADPLTSKIAWGVIHSAVGVALVSLGGFGVFEKLMSACIAVMFVTVVVTAALARPDWGAVLSGMVVPSIPQGSMGWILGILGGVGGTVTLLSYSYWIREQNRTGRPGLRACRIDLSAGYLMTAVFGLCMVIVGSKVRVSGGGAKVALDLAKQLEKSMGRAGRYTFLLGFWAAVFSSLLGVWQSIPYMVADFFVARSGKTAEQRAALDYSKTIPYRVYLGVISVVSLPMLWVSVKKAQLAYGVLGSLFMPLLAVTLLMMNNRKDWVPAEFRNTWPFNSLLALTLAFFSYAGYVEATRLIRQLLA